MSVRVQLFGPYADAAQGREVRIEAGPDGTLRAQEVMERLAGEVPALGPMLDGARLAVNHRFVSTDATVREADEVAVVGLVSGG